MVDPDSAKINSTVDSIDPMITIAWTETTRYQTRITLSEARELLLNKYRSDLRPNRTPDDIAELLTEIDLDDHLNTHRDEAWHDRSDHEIEWIKPQ